MANTALGKLAPGRLTDELIATAKDTQTDSYLREKALVTLCNRIRDLVPLLDDTTLIVYSPPLRPGAEWRICDRTAMTISTLLGWGNRMATIYIQQDQRDELMKRVRQWAKQNP